MVEEFEQELEKINSPGIKEWCRFHLTELPEHFWTDPASFSGKYHRGESRVQHIKNACAVGEHLINIMAMTPLEADQTRAAILLHDGATYNNGGHVNSNHGEAMAGYLSIESMGRPTIGDAKWPIVNAVKRHMGWWAVEPVDWRE